MNLTGRGNSYVDDNIWEIQELYIEDDQQEKDKGKVKKEEVILIKPYEVSESSSIKRVQVLLTKKLTTLLST